MKVICIDGKPSLPEAKPLPEGVILEAFQCKVHKDNYDIVGYEKGIYGVPISHGKRRFIPLSTIDETELLHNRQTELV